MIPAHVLRVWLTAPRDLEFKKLPLHPEKIRPTEVCAVTECSAVSVGTELAAYEGQEPLRPGTPYPRLLGYSNVARVVRVGRRVRRAKPGDRIFTNQCHQSAFICDQNAILARIPKQVDSATAALTYLAHIALCALQRTELRKQEVVAVLGLGPIGLAAVAIAKTMGGRVVAIGNDGSRLEKARELGADVCVRSDDPDMLDRVEGTLGRRDVDLVLTTVNSWEGWLLALELPRYGGRIAVLGFPGRGHGLPPFNPLTPRQTYVKQLRIFHCGLATLSKGEKTQRDVKHNMPTLLRMVEKGRLPLEKLLTHRAPWSELERVYSLALRHDKGLIGAVLEWTVPTG
jgi:threonine dehydrogenase-like Zn-dependent dehydrogenase